MNIWFYRTGEQYNGDISKLAIRSADRAELTRPRKCRRCGGAGGSIKWQHTGTTCYDCNGNKFNGVETLKLYTADKLTKLVAAQTKRDAAKFEANRARQEAADSDRLAAKAQTITNNRANHPVASAILTDQDVSGNKFLDSIRDKFNDGYPLTEKMASAVIKSWNALTAKQDFDGMIADLEANGTKPTTGRQTISGYVLTIKWHDSQYGATLKVLMMDERGFKIWVSCPNDLVALVYDKEDEYHDLKKGYRMHVQMTATLEPKDNCFAIGKRPSKFQVVS